MESKIYFLVYCNLYNRQIVMKTHFDLVAQINYLNS